ncbi:MAG: response regulator [Nitrospira sp.]
MAFQPSRAPEAGSEPIFGVLLADDSPESQALIRLYLHGLPYRIDVVGNGEEAVVMFQSRQFDIVILDQHMPVMDGFTAARLMRKWESSIQCAQVPILTLTADSLVETKKQCQAAGCTAFLAKPIAKGQLLAALHQYVAIASTERATPRNSSPTGIAALINEEIARRRPLFLDNRRQELRCIQDAIERGDCEFIRVTGHRIRGLAGSYGFPDIGLAGAQLEQAARDQDVAAIRRTIDRLAALLTQANQTV